MSSRSLATIAITTMACTIVVLGVALAAKGGGASTEERAARDGADGDLAAANQRIADLEDSTGMDLADCFRANYPDAPAALFQ